MTEISELAYTPTSWTDGVTPVNAANMNKIESELMSLDTIVGAGVFVATDSVAAAATRVQANKLVAGDAQPAFRYMGDGKHEWGPGGATVPDIALSRTAANVMTLNAELRMLSPNVTVDGNRYYFGPSYDTSLYRSGADMLKSDDRILSGVGFTADTDNASYPALRSVRAAGNLVLGSLLLSADANYAYRVRGNGMVEWGAGGATAVDTTLYRTAAGVLKTDGAFYAVSFIAAQLGTNQVIAGEISPFVGGGARPGLVFGNANDTNLYRAGADVLKTDDTLQVGGNVSLTGASSVLSLTGASSYIYAGAGSAGSGILLARVSGDVDNRFTLTNQGRMLWGDGALTWDTNLYRSAAGVLKTDGALEFSTTLQHRPATYAAGELLNSKAVNEAQKRFLIQNDGGHSWGPGGATGVDAFLSRSGVARLQMTDTTLLLTRQTLGSSALWSMVTGDTAPAFSIWAGGQLNWGPGGSAATDTNLYRKAVGLLGSDSPFRGGADITANSSAAGAFTANSVAIGHSGSGLGPYILFGGDTFIFRSQLNSLRCVVFEATAFNNYSDARWKKNIRPLKSSWEAVKALSPVSYRWRNKDDFKDDGRDHLGFLAQDVEKPIPSAVSSTLTAAGRADEAQPLLLNSMDILATLTKALQEAMTRIEVLEAK